MWDEERRAKSPKPVDCEPARPQALRDHKGQQKFEASRLVSL
jgi:hypothetical protein